MNRIWLVSFLSWTVSGVSASSVACSMCEMCPTSVDIPVAVTTNCARAPGHVRVHVDHVGAVAERRLGRLDGLPRPWRRAGSRRSAPTPPPRASPPTAGGRRRHDVARLDRDDVPGHELLAGIWTSSPSRCTLALTIIIFCSAATASAAFPSWRRPSTALNSVRKSSTSPVPKLVQRVEAADARNEQDDLHRVAVLAHERPPARLDRGLGELVRADRGNPGRGFGGREAAAGFDAQPPDGVIGSERVPCNRPGVAEPVGLQREPVLPSTCHALLPWVPSQKREATPPHLTTGAVIPLDFTRAKLPPRAAYRAEPGAGMLTA